MSWDTYFKQLCDAVADNSKCLSRKIGCVIATKDHSVITVGYNGPPRKTRHCKDRPVTRQWYEDAHVWKCPRRIMGFASGEGLQHCPAAHAETNAIVTAAREGARSLKGCTLYLNTGVPCMECMKLIIQAGIDEIVCADKGNFYDLMSGNLVEETGIVVREFRNEGR